METGVTQNDRSGDRIINVRKRRIKEHRIQDSMAQCLRGKRHAERQYTPNITYKCIKSKAETEIYMGEKSIKKLILD